MQALTKTPLVVEAGQGKKMNVIGNQVTLRLTSQETGGEYYVFEAVTPPGVGVPPHVHQHEDEIIEVIEGEYEFLLGDEMYRVTSGALVYFPRFIPHAFKNVGARPGLTHWTVIPGANFEKFFAELGSLPADGSPDLGKVAEIFARYDIELLPPPEA